MKAQFYRIVAGSVLLAGFAVACRKDPTASGVGAPAEVILDFSALRLDQGDSATIEAKIVDNRLTPLEGDITFASCDAGTATVVPNAGFDPRPPTAAQAIVHAVGTNVTCITASAEGVKPDTVNVTVLPTRFAGTLSAATLEGGTQLTISSTATLKFDPATVKVRFPGAGAATIISKTADALEVLAPFGATPGPLTIDGIVVTYVTGLTTSLSTASSVTVTGDWGLSTTTPVGGSTFAIASTATLKFSDSTNVVHPGLGALPVISRTTDTIKVLSAYTSGHLTITNVDVTFAPGLVVSMPTAATVRPSGDSWAGDDDWQTAPDITSLLPGAGSTAVFISTTASGDNSAVCPEAALGFGSTGPCMMFKFTLASAALVKFTTSWEGTATAPDIDIYVCADSAVANFGTACFEDGGAGATGSLPQVTGPNNTLAAGVHWFVIEVYGGGTTANIKTTIEQ